MQAKLAVAPAGGFHEQDADRAADQWLRSPKKTIRVHAITPVAWQDGIVVSTEVARRIDWIRGQGSPLPPALRRQFESRMQRSLAGVRIHTSSEAAELAALLDARAFTSGRDVFFGSCEWQPNTQAGQRLLAHELAHTVQQSQGAADPGVQREEKGRLDRFKDWAAEKTSEAVSLVGDAAMSVVRKYAPGLARVIDAGPLEYIRAELSGAIEGWLAETLQDFSIEGILAKVRGGVSAILAKLDGLRKPSAEACKSFATTLGTIRNFISDIFDNPVFAFLKTNLEKFQATMVKISAFVLAPVFDLFRDQAVSTWNAIKKVAGWIWSGIKAVKDFAGTALEWVLKRLGIDIGESEGEEGVWGWVRRKASQVWTVIRDTLAPVVAPLKTAIKVGLALSPLGPIYVLIRYGPRVVKSIEWLWSHRDDPKLIETAHKEMADTILPDILDAITNADEKLGEGVDWLTGQVEDLASSVLDFVGKMAGLPLLGTAKNWAARVSEGLQATVAWGRETLKKGAELFRKAVADITRIIEPYKKTLSLLAQAVVNPGMIPNIIADWAWRAIPTCFKIPIIDFMLGIVIRALTLAPELPMMGPLWPLLKSAVVAALETFRKQDDKTKEDLTNKVARIISGGSPDFLLGFVKGFLTGVWETLTDPIKAIWSIVEGLNTLLELFDKWTGGGETEVIHAVPKVGTVAAAAPGPAPVTPILVVAPAAATAALAPATEAPASAAPDQASVPEGGEEAEPAAVGEDVRLGPEDQAALGERLGQMGKELQPPVQVVTGQFWRAAEEYFSASGGTSFPQLIAKLGEAWEDVRKKIQDESSKLAKKMIDYMISDAADGEIGDKLGWITGLVSTQLLLDYLTAGTTEVLKPLQAVAKLLNWPMEMMGKAFQLIGKVGKYMVSWVKKLGGMVKDAAAGAFVAVKDALGLIGSKLVQFAEEIIARFSKFAGKRAGAGVKGATGLARHEAEQLGQKGLRQAAKGAVTGEGERLGEQGLVGAGKKEGVVLAEERAQQQMAKDIDAADDVGRSVIPGHEIKVTEGGMLVRCSTECQLMAQRYKIVLDSNKDLRTKLMALQKRAKTMSKSDLKKAAEELEEEILDVAIRDMIRSTGRDIKDVSGAMKAIKENPEQLEKVFDIQASRVKEALKATGEEMLDVASHTTGVPSEFRKPLRSGATTPELRSGVNEGFTPGVKDPALPGRFINKPLEADHLFSLKRLIQESGFGELSYEEMLLIARYKGNFAGLSKSANASKGAKSFAEWLEHKSAGIKVDPQFRREMFLKEVKAEDEILALIEKVKEFGI